ncbi:MAG: hypothetical protein NZ898_10910 [Myxococcota bacterium]|nr:hypothetical protein [Myxococcota bacterium]MDW8364039.1 hypothetical protein [Myxococcales bacterium]
MKAVLLGAQRFEPTLGRAVADLGVEGPIATVTAGWQEREDEDEELDAHLGGRTINLRLHRRAEDVFARHAWLREAHRARQERLRLCQDFYRIRLDHALEAARVIDRRAAPPELLEEERESSIATVRAIDEHHLRLCRQVHEEFEHRHGERVREATAAHRAELEALVRDCGAVAIAGGHVASLLNRLRLFDVASLLGERPLFAWSGGAMVVTDRVVLFHDSPPHGSAAPQILDAGLGLVRGVVVLPAPEMRLRLDDAERMSLYARRFAPAVCLVLPRCSRITWDDGLWLDARGILRLRTSGRAVPLGPPA